MIIKTTFDIAGGVDTANDGQKGLDAFKARVTSQLGKEKCDCGLEQCPNRFYRLIFMDLNMPVMDGYESARNILQFQTEKELQHPVTIVSLTAYTNAEYLKRCFTIGMAKILNKPAKKVEVQEVI